MPPRKSDVSKAVDGDEAAPAKETLVKEGINIEDLNLPKSIVTRLAKGVLPANTQIQGNAMIAMSKSATIFVNYLASAANENAATAGRRTITPQDVLKALDDIEFGDFKPRLEADLAKFNETQTDKRNAYRKKVAADKTPSKPSEGEEPDDDGGEKEGGDGEPKAKKAKRDNIDQALSREDTLNQEQGQEHDEGDEEEVQEESEEEEEEEDGEDGEDEVTTRLELEEQMEEEQREVEDEAMDNGDDSD